MSCVRAGNEEILSDKDVGRRWDRLLGGSVEYRSGQ